MKTAQDILDDKKAKLLTIPRDAMIIKAVQTMIARRVGAILVTPVDGDAIIGIWTERDLMRNILEPGFKADTACIGDYMVQSVYSAAHDASLEKLQDMFLGLYIRHILIKNQDREVGLISVGDVIRAGLLEKDKTIKELNAIASWEYYENWGWSKKKNN